MHFLPGSRTDPRVTLRAMSLSTLGIATVVLRLLSRVVPVVLEVLDDQNEIIDPEAVTEIVVRKVQEDGGVQVGAVTARTLSLLVAGVVSLAMDLRGRS